MQEDETSIAIKSTGAAFNADGSKKWWYNIQNHIFLHANALIDSIIPYLTNIPLQFFICYQGIHGSLH